MEHEAAIKSCCACGAAAGGQCEARHSQCNFCGFPSLHSVVRVALRLPLPHDSPADGLHFTNAQLRMLGALYGFSLDGAFQSKHVLAATNRRPNLQEWLSMHGMDSGAPSHTLLASKPCMDAKRLRRVELCDMDQGPPLKAARAETSDRNVMPPPPQPVSPVLPSMSAADGLQSVVPLVQSASRPPQADVVQSSTSEAGVIHVADASQAIARLDLPTDRAILTSSGGRIVGHPMTTRNGAEASTESPSPRVSSQNSSSSGGSTAVGHSTSHLVSAPSPAACAPSAAQVLLSSSGGGSAAASACGSLLSVSPSAHLSPAAALVQDGVDGVSPGCDLEARGSELGNASEPKIACAVAGSHAAGRYVTSQDQGVEISRGTRRESSEPAHHEAQGEARSAASVCAPDGLASSVDSGVGGVPFTNRGVAEAFHLLRSAVNALSSVRRAESCMSAGEWIWTYGCRQALAAARQTRAADRERCFELLSAEACRRRRGTKSAGPVGVRHLVCSHIRNAGASRVSLSAHLWLALSHAHAYRFW